MNLKYKPAVLMILDGYGITNPHDSNAIWLAKTPCFENLIRKYPTMLLEAASYNVGLPFGEVGNSEVGHVNIGSGVLQYQSLPRIDRAIEDGPFFKNPTLLQAVERVKKNKSNLHLMGLLGNGGVHAHQRHLNALIDFCKQQKLQNVFLHLFLDGRDSAKNSAQGFLKDIADYCKKAKVGTIASLSGRFYAMDRNNNWERVAKAYDCIANGRAAKKIQDPMGALEESYKNEIFDEEFIPTVITDKKGLPLAPIKKEDAVIFFNYRADRAKQMTEAFVKPDFKKFDREFLDGLLFITFSEYGKDLPAEVVFPVQTVKNPLGKIISENKLTQLRIAETEKYAHVTFFLNGLQEEKFKGEERILIPSPAVASYDEKPEMSAGELTEELIKAIESGKFDFIVVNYANPDMVAHTGNLKATVQAIEFVDKCVERVVAEVNKKNGVVFIVADHGNAEEMVNLQTGKMDKEHSIYPVPFIVVSQSHEGQIIQPIESKDLSIFAPTGILPDVAPTILTTLGVPMAPEMTGSCLL